MKKLILLSIASLMASANAFALGALNCSNAEGTIKRVEVETWGANQVKFVFPGGELDSAEATVKLTGQVVLKESKPTPDGREHGLGGSHKIFAAHMSFARRDGSPLLVGTANKIETQKVSDWVICHSWKNGALD